MRADSVRGRFFQAYPCGPPRNSTPWPTAWSGRDDPFVTMRVRPTAQARRTPHAPVRCGHRRSWAATPQYAKDRGTAWGQGRFSRVCSHPRGEICRRGPMESNRHTRWWLLALVGVALVLTGCGGRSTATPSAARPVPASAAGIPGRAGGGVPPPVPSGLEQGEADPYWQRLYERQRTPRGG
jgi:hypothetical protein